MAIPRRASSGRTTSFSARPILPILYFAAWDQVPTNKVIGALWPNDNDGQAFSKIFTALAEKKGYKVVDPGRFDLPTGNYNAQISAFKAGKRRDRLRSAAAAGISLPSPAPPRSRISGRR